MMGRLGGKQIINTRAMHQAKALDDLLRLQGAVPLAYPCIDTIPPEDCSRLDRALLDLATGHYEWLLLTSTNTVFALAKRLSVLDVDLMSSAFHTAAIGVTTATTAKLLLHLEKIDIPIDYAVEALADTLPITPYTRILLPVSDIARSTLAKLLTDKGAQVNVVTAYRTICGSGGVDMPKLLAEKQIDAITFTSSSTVTYFLERLQDEEGRLEDALDLCAACIGSKTAATALSSGFKVVMAASEPTLESLVGALDRYFTNPLLSGNDI